MLVIQRTLPAYRVAFFDRLSDEVKSLKVVFGQSPIMDKVKLASDIRPWREEISTFYIGPLIYQPGLLGAVLRGRPRVIVSEFNLWMVMNYVVFFWAKFQHIPFYWWTTAWEPPSHSRLSRSIRKQILVFFAKKAAGILVYNSKARATVASWGVKEGNIYLCPNSLDVEALAVQVDELKKNTERLEDVRSQLARRDQFLVLTVGALEPNKRLDLLIQALVIVRRKIDAVLVVVGGGRERVHLEQEAKVADGAVKFLGPVADSTMVSTYGLISDVFVMPGVGGLALIHAAICGLPLVSTGEGDGTDGDLLVEGQNGFFAQPNNPENLAEKIINVFEERSKEGRFGRESIRRAKEKFGFDKMISAFRSICHE